MTLPENLRQGGFVFAALTMVGAVPLLLIYGLMLLAGHRPDAQEISDLEVGVIGLFIFLSVMSLVMAIGSSIGETTWWRALRFWRRRRSARRSRRRRRRAASKFLDKGLPRGPVRDHVALGALGPAGLPALDPRLRPELEAPRACPDPGPGPGRGGIHDGTPAGPTPSRAHAFVHALWAPLSIGAVLCVVSLGPWSDLLAFLPGPTSTALVWWAVLILSVTVAVALHAARRAARDPVRYFLRLAREADENGPLLLFGRYRSAGMEPIGTSPSALQIIGWFVANGRRSNRLEVDVQHAVELRRSGVRLSRRDLRGTRTIHATGRQAKSMTRDERVILLCEPHSAGGADPLVLIDRLGLHPAALGRWSRQAAPVPTVGLRSLTRSGDGKDAPSSVSPLRSRSRQGERAST